MVRAFFWVLAGCAGNFRGIAAEVQDCVSSCPDYSVTAEDVLLGVSAVAIEVVVLVIVGLEVKGTGLHFVAVIAWFVVGIAALQGTEPGVGRLGGFFNRGGLLRVGFHGG